MIRGALAVALSVALLSCKLDAKPAPAPSATPSASASSMAVVASSAPASPSATSPPRVVALPRPPPAKTPIRDCHVPEGEDEMSCCSDAGMKQLEPKLVNRSIEECKKIDRLPVFSSCPTFFARGFHAAVETCFQGAEERELDRRLLPLKDFDRLAFHREMALQKSFNEALRKTCDDVLDHEQSTSDFRGELRCTTFLFELRQKQARAIAEGGLELAREPADKAPRAKLFKPFAKELCAIADLWKGPAPSRCEDRVLGEIDDALASAAKF